LVARAVCSPSCSPTGTATKFPLVSIWEILLQKGEVTEKESYCYTIQNTALFIPSLDAAPVATKQSGYLG